MPDAIAHDCLLTPKIQQALSRKRNSLGLSYRAIGDFFHVSWSTFRKWETPSDTPVFCRRVYLPMLNGLLAGEYDDALRGSQEPMGDLLETWKTLPALMHQCLVRITTTYALCKGHPDLQKNLLESIDRASRQAIREMIEP